MSNSPKKSIEPIFPVGQVCGFPAVRTKSKPLSAETLRSARQTSIKKELPPSLTLNGFRQNGTVNVKRASKPPKLRFQIGTYVRYEGELHEILFAYRLTDDPHEWVYCLEQRDSLLPSEMQGGPLHAMVVAMGAGKHTPRIVYELFRSFGDAWQFFRDIPAAGDRRSVPNKKLLHKATVVSSGPVLPK